MSEDPFAAQVDRLTQRHRQRHVPSIVAEVTLQRWLAMRRRYNDPFDPELFDHIDESLAHMPPSVNALTPPGTRSARAAR